MAYIREYPSGLSVSWNFGQIVRWETRPLCTARLYFIFDIWKHLENADKEIQSNEFLLAMNSCCLRCIFTIMLMRAILSTLLNSHLSVSGELYLDCKGWRMVKSETSRDAEILVRNPSPRLFGEKFRDSKKVKTNHEKTRLRDLSKTFPRFRDPAKIFRDSRFLRYHSPPLLQLYTPDRLYNNENCMRAIPRSMSTLPCLKVLPGKAIIFFSISSHMAFRRRLISVGLGRQGLTDSLIWFMILA